MMTESQKDKLIVIVIFILISIWITLCAFPLLSSGQCDHFEPLGCYYSVDYDYSQVDQHYEENGNITCLNALPQNPDIAVYQGYYYRSEYRAYCREA